MSTQIIGLLTIVVTVSVLVLVAVRMNLKLSSREPDSNAQLYRILLTSKIKEVPSSQTIRPSNYLTNLPKTTVIERSKISDRRRGMTS